MGGKINLPWRRIAIDCREDIIYAFFKVVVKDIQTHCSER